jgi:hypothetical protein
VPIAGIAPPSSKAYDLVLLVHVGLAVVALVSTIAAAASARSLERAHGGGPWPVAGARYFSPGHEIVGRSLYLIPITGMILIGISRGAVSVSDAFVEIGLVLWLIVALVAERAVFAPAAVLRRLVASTPTVPTSDEWRRSAVTLRWGVDAVILLVLAAAAVMVAQP